jgi:hypothetical protein
MKNNEVALMAALQNKQEGGHFKSYTKFLLSDGKSYVLCGELHDDPRWSNGSLIHTSLVIYHHVDENIIETRNTYYTLGTEVTEESNNAERCRLLSAL